MTTPCKGNLIVTRQARKDRDRCAVRFSVSAAVDRANNVGDRRTKEFPACDTKVSTTKVTEVEFWLMLQ